MRNFRKNNIFGQRRHFDVILGNFDVILVILTSFWRHILKYPQNRQKTCYRRHWPLVGKLLSCTLRKCKNGTTNSSLMFLLTVQIWPKIEKQTSRRKMTSRRRNVTKMETHNPFIVTNFCANIKPFGLFMRKLWQKQFLKDFYRISSNFRT